MQQIYLVLFMIESLLHNAIYDNIVVITANRQRGDYVICELNRLQFPIAIYSTLFMYTVLPYFICVL